MKSLVWMKGRLTKIFKTTTDFGSFVFCTTKMRCHIKVLIFQRSLLKVCQKVVTWSHCCYFGLWWWNEGVQVCLSFCLQWWVVTTVHLLLISSIAGKLDCILQCPGIPSQTLRCLAGLLLCEVQPCSQSPSAGRGHAVSTRCFWVKCQLQNGATLINTMKD